MKTTTYDPGSVYRTIDGVRVRQTKLLSKVITVKDKGDKNTASETENDKLHIFAIPANTFRAYKEDAKSEDRQLSVIGQTKLKQISDENSETTKADAVLLVENNSGIERRFEVRDRYKFSRVVGYLPVGEDQFIAVVSFNPIYLGVLLVLLLGLVLGVYFATLPQEENLTDNRYIEEVSTTEVHTDQSSTRYRLNTTLTVAKNTIQNLDFENINEGKYLRLKIKLDYENDTDYIYDSELVPFGKKVTADTLLKDVPAGTYHTIAECYSYSMEKEQLSQTNFKITLIVK